MAGPGRLLPGRAARPFRPAGRSGGSGARRLRRFCRQRRSPPRFALPDPAFRPAARPKRTRGGAAGGRRSARPPAPARAAGARTTRLAHARPQRRGARRAPGRPGRLPAGARPSRTAARPIARRGPQNRLPAGQTGALRRALLPHPGRREGQRPLRPGFWLRGKSQIPQPARNARLPRLEPAFAPPRIRGDLLPHPPAARGTQLALPSARPRLDERRRRERNRQTAQRCPSPRRRAAAAPAAPADGRPRARLPPGAGTLRSRGLPPQPAAGHRAGRIFRRPRTGLCRHPAAGYGRGARTLQRSPLPRKTPFAAIRAVALCARPAGPGWPRYLDRSRHHRTPAHPRRHAF